MSFHGSFIIYTARTYTTVTLCGQVAAAHLKAICLPVAWLESWYFLGHCPMCWRKAKTMHRINLSSDVKRVSVADGARWRVPRSWWGQAASSCLATDNPQGVWAQTQVGVAVMQCRASGPGPNHFHTPTREGPGHGDTGVPRAGVRDSWTDKVFSSSSRSAGQTGTDWVSTYGRP